MSNFELIDDYLTNRLNEQEKADVERQLGSDPAFKADVELQKHILEGVKKARVADLKAMLNNVPVGGGFSSGIGAAKIAAAVVTAGIVGTSLYFYFKPKEEKQVLTPTVSQEQPIKESSEKISDSIAHDAVPVAAEQHEVAGTPAIAKKSTKKKNVASSGVHQPKIEVVDPSDELIDNSTDRHAKADNQKSGVTSSHIPVENRNDDKKYNFHYQFREGKLILYGKFDKSLYEILEIHSDRHAVFLFYKDSYYLLNEKQTSITQLEPIRDAVLLRKLKEYRGQ